MSASFSDALSFEDLGLDPRLVEAVVGLGFSAPTPIQGAALPPLLAGHDIIGCARTGSGKTAAFGLPLLERLKDGGPHVRALLLAPTRELALQVTEALRKFAKRLPVRVVTLYGGVEMVPQLRSLAQGPTIVVGTPGRVLDHLRRGSLELSHLEVLVLDEADEMLRMGFIEDVETVLAAAPEDKQVALFSATMPEPIRKIASAYLRDPVEIQVETQALQVDHIEQRAMLVDLRERVPAIERILAAEARDATLIFTRTRAGCAELADALAARGVQVDALHGDLNQAARERVLARLRARSLDVVIATDVAARGIDVDHITHVINADLPDDPEVYVHRIGRTGRAGRKGVAISLVPPRLRGRMRGFEHALKCRIEKVEVPSDDDIRARQRAVLKESIASLLEEGAGETTAALVRELAEEGGLEDVAAAALALFARARGIALEGPVAIPAIGRRRREAFEPRRDEREPRRFEQRQSEREPRRFEPRRDDDAPLRPRRDDAGPRPSRDDEDHIELFFPVGRRHGVSAGNLVGALANGAGVPGIHIGRITLLDAKSFVNVARHLAEPLIEKRFTLNVRGVDVVLSRSNGKGEAAEMPARRGAAPKKGGPKTDRKKGPKADRPPMREKREGKAPRPSKQGKLHRRGG